jgi:phenylalanyl-tRNA synthetase beta chain
MRIPLSWLHDYVDPGLTAEELAEVLTFGGFEVEAVHRPTAGARGVVVAEVRSVEKVEGSDKLHLVEAFDGERTEQVVCGAANYAPGDRVAWARPGSLLPGGVDVGRKKLFGVTSNGMLASQRELGVGEDHRGIWVLDRDAPLGADVAEWLDLDDAVLEIAVTPDRAYGLSVLGVARDVAALTGAALHLPAASAPPAAASGVPVTIEDSRRCRRFDARRVDGVTLGPSPAWLQRRLAAAGMRPISNIVDATNHAMLETGHPVHAYDLDRLAGPRIDVRQGRPGERVMTLDGVERELHPDDLVIADADGTVGIAGVMGGEGTEVSEGTRSVLVEVACFDPVTVSRTARRHKLFTEASTRFERTVPAETVPLGATRCVELLVELAGGEVTGGEDAYPAPPQREVIRLRPDRARRWLGMDVDDGRQRAMLESIACEVTPQGEGTMTVIPPPYRQDLRQEADLYEEIARLHGYDKVPATVPSAGAAGGREPEDDARRVVRGVLAGGGWSEVIVFPFISDDDVDALGYDADDRRRRTMPLQNPLSREESVLRTTLLPGLLRTVRHNVNRQTTDLALFEVGRVFLHPTPEEPGADGGPGGTVLPAEPLLLGFAACGAFEAARHDREARVADVYDLLGGVDLVRRAIGLDPLEVAAVTAMPFHPGRAAELLYEGQAIGALGELHPRVCAAFEVPPWTVAGELRLDRLVAGGLRPSTVRAPSTLPGLRFDVAVVVGEDVPASEVERAVRAGAGERLTVCTLFDVFRGPQLGEARKSLAYAIRLDDPGRQLTDTDEAEAITSIEQAVADAVDGRLRR